MFNWNIDIRNISMGYKLMLIVYTFILFIDIWIYIRILKNVLGQGISLHDFTLVELPLQ
jgi:hypothetical protein